MSKHPTSQPFPLIYRDRDNLYLELLGLPGHVLRFAFTAAGLHKALAHIPDVSPHQHYVASGRSNVAAKFLPKAKVAKATRAKREVAGFSQEARDAASEIVRKLKLGED